MSALQDTMNGVVAVHGPGIAGTQYQIDEFLRRARAA